MWHLYLFEIPHNEKKKLKLNLTWSGGLFPISNIQNILYALSQKSQFSLAMKIRIYFVVYS